MASGVSEMKKTKEGRYSLRVLKKSNAGTHGCEVNGKEGRCGDSV
jgi:hypothetical protein